jgi:predicted nucleic acid-binding protein
VNPCVVDASVAVKWILPAEDEKLGSEAVHLLDLNTLGKAELLVPDLFWTECGNVLWKAVRSERCSKPVAEKGLATLKAYKLITIASVGLFERAFAIASTFDRTVYDSLYVALAVEHGIELVTADQRLVNTLAPLFPVKWLGAL